MLMPPPRGVHPALAAALLSAAILLDELRRVVRNLKAERAERDDRNRKTTHEIRAKPGR